MLKLIEIFNKMLTKTNIRNVIGILSVLAGFLIITIMLYHEVPRFNQRLVDMAFGGMLANIGSVYNFFFGSSKSEADKLEKPRKEDKKDLEES